MRLKKVFFVGVMVSLSLAALVGIWCFLFPGQYGRIEDRGIETTASMVLFCLTALGAAYVLEKVIWKIAMIAGLVLSGLGLVLFPASIWGLFDFPPFYHGRWDDVLQSTMRLTAVWAIALPHAGLIAQARFSNWIRWVRFATIGGGFLLAAACTVYIVGLNWSGFYLYQDVFLRDLGALSLLVALGTLAVPILHKLKRIDKFASSESTKLELQVTCPRCFLTQTIQSGHSHCSHCRLKFHLEIEEPRCPQYNYLLHQLTSPRCPECGQALAPEEIAPAPGLAPTPVADKV
jgi:hypothetical protein